MSPDPKDLDTTRKTIVRMTYVAIFGALAFVLTLFARIPYPNGQGYLNFGDAVDLLISMSLGPVEGALVGMLAGCLSDFAADSAMFVPWTLLAKGLMGLACGFIFILLRKRKYVRYLAPFIGSALMIITYLVSYYVYFGLQGTFYSLFDLIQGLVCSILACSLHFALEKSGFLKRFGD